jgi:hypothetical protein
VGYRAGFKAKAELSGFTEPSQKQGDKLSGDVTAVADADVSFFGWGVGMTYSAQIGYGTEGMISKAPELSNPKFSKGPLSVDSETGRRSFTIGLGWGGSVGVDGTITGSRSLNNATRTPTPDNSRRSYR